MADITYVPLRTDLLVRLVQKHQDQFGRVIEATVEKYLDTNDESRLDGWLNKLDLAYMWDQWPLPDGTKLRTSYRGNWKIAELKNRRFEYKGENYASPAKVCNAMRGHTSNNAWKMLEIKRPQDVAYRLADRLRG